MPTSPFPTRSSLARDLRAEIGDRILVGPGRPAGYTVRDSIAGLQALLAQQSIAMVPAGASGPRYAVPDTLERTVTAESLGVVTLFGEGTTGVRPLRRSYGDERRQADGTIGTTPGAAPVYDAQWPASGPLSADVSAGDRVRVEQPGIGWSYHTAKVDLVVADATAATRPRITVSGAGTEWSVTDNYSQAPVAAQWVRDCDLVDLCRASARLIEVLPALAATAEALDAHVMLTHDCERLQVAVWDGHPGFRLAADVPGSDKVILNIALDVGPECHLEFGSPNVEGVTGSYAPLVWTACTNHKRIDIRMPERMISDTYADEIRADVEASQSGTTTDTGVLRDMAAWFRLAAPGHPSAMGYDESEEGTAPYVRDQAVFHFARYASIRATGAEPDGHQQWQTLRFERDPGVSLSVGEITLRGMVGTHVEWDREGEVDDQIDDLTLECWSQGWGQSPFLGRSHVGRFEIREHIPADLIPLVDEARPYDAATAYAAGAVAIDPSTEVSTTETDEPTGTTGHLWRKLSSAAAGTVPTEGADWTRDTRLWWTAIGDKHYVYETRGSGAWSFGRARGVHVVGRRLAWHRLQRNRYTFAWRQQGDDLGQWHGKSETYFGPGYFSGRLWASEGSPCLMEGVHLDQRIWRDHAMVRPRHLHRLGGGGRLVRCRADGNTGIEFVDAVYAALEWCEMRNSEVQATSGAFVIWGGAYEATTFGASRMDDSGQNALNLGLTGDLQLPRLLVGGGATFEGGSQEWIFECGGTLILDESVVATEGTNQSALVRNAGGTNVAVVRASNRQLSFPTRGLTREGDDAGLRRPGVVHSAPGADGSSTAVTLTHSLGAQAVEVFAVSTSTGAHVRPTITASTATTVTYTDDLSGHTVYVRGL